MPDHYEDQTPPVRRRNLLTGPEWDEEEVAAQDQEAATVPSAVSGSAAVSGPAAPQLAQGQPTQDQQGQLTQRRNLFFDAFPEDRPAAQPSAPSTQPVQPSQQPSQPQRRPGALLESVSAGPLQEIEEKGFVADVASAFGRGVGAAVEMTGGRTRQAW